MPDPSATSRVKGIGSAAGGRLTGDPRHDDRVIDARLDSLDEERLNEFGLPFYELNFLRLHAGPDRSPARARALARQALRRTLRAEYLFDSRLLYLKRELEDLARGDARRALRRRPFLRGWEARRIRRRLREAGGVLVATFHFGSHRFVPVDLIRLGFDVVLPVDESAHEKYGRITGDMHPEFSDRLHLLRVEDRRSVRSLVRALRGGRVVVVYADGNTGPDGRWGEAGRTDVELMGSTLKAKAGMGRLAARLGIPVTPVFAHPGNGGDDIGDVELPAPISPGDQKDGAGASQLVQALYDLLEARIRRHPACWEHSRFVHRWSAARGTPSPAEHDDEAVGTAVREALARDRTVHMNRDRVVSFRRENLDVWVDARTLRSYRAPAWCPELFDALEEGGIGSGWLASSVEGDEARRRALGLLAELARRGAVRIEGSPRGRGPEAPTNDTPDATSAQTRRDPGEGASRKPPAGLTGAAGNRSP